MSLEEEVTRAMSTGSRAEVTDADSKIKNLESAVSELQDVAARLAREIDQLKGTS
jgi:hypothetical protein